MLDKLDELGISDNTIVLYTTDNGAEKFSWPDGGTVRFRGEKNTTWEGGFRAPAMVRWPGKIKSGQVVNEMTSHLDWIPTIMAAVGDTEIKAQLKQGTTINGQKYKIHLDGFNILPQLKTGKNTTADDNSNWPRKNFIYATDGGKVAAIRMGDWKLLFLEQKCKGWEVWACPLVARRLPLILNLRQDPYEEAPINAGGYDRWSVDHLFTVAPAATEVIKFLQTFKEFPPSQAPADFTFSTVVEKMKIWENVTYK